MRTERTRHLSIHFCYLTRANETRQALQSRVVFVNAPLERSESDSSASIGVSILREISIGTVQIFQYRYLSKYRYFWQHYLVGAPFALITASIRRGMEVISLWHCWGGMEAQVALIAAFRSSALLGLVSLIFRLTSSGQASLLANQAQ